MHFSKVSAITMALAVRPDVLAASSNGNALNIRAPQKIYTKPVVKEGPFLPAKPEPEPVPEVKPDPVVKNPNPKPAPVVKPNANTIQPSTPTQETTTSFKGYASYYYPGDQTSQCGVSYTKSDYVVALDERRFDTSLCGKQIRVTTTAGRTVDVIVAGSTKGGPDENWLDLSYGAFQTVSSIDLGMIPVTWNYLQTS
ncbi:uncharacterized protein B0J16DRAFT_321236 [Fusarium flagelliforme]|uniref:uncharacterized protein n=1 Tax=Fusarium flagelliforme TaxID=2675880 RepID=UPI001E8CD411|nr:uncharacterized protein B0J16DRAFT_321236 [Fusarium flagelliforme]KAH7182457.1 hypothetical protein B0J16DRAFT_321236 [Fusarium flagelliforme]